MIPVNSSHRSRKKDFSGNIFTNSIRNITGKYMPELIMIISSGVLRIRLVQCQGGRCAMLVIVWYRHAGSSLPIVV